MLFCAVSCAKTGNRAGKTQNLAMRTFAGLRTVYASIWNSWALRNQIETNDDRSMTLQNLRIHSWRAEGENVTAQKDSEKVIIAQIEACGAQGFSNWNERIRNWKTTCKKPKISKFWPALRWIWWVQIQMRESETENRLSRYRKSTNPGLWCASGGKIDIRVSQTTKCLPGEL